MNSRLVDREWKSIQPKNVSYLQLFILYEYLLENSVYFHLPNFLITPIAFPHALFFSIICYYLNTTQLPTSNISKFIINLFHFLNLFFHFFQDGAGTNKQHAGSSNPGRLERETDEYRHSTIPLEIGKLIKDGRMAKGLKQSDLAAVSISIYKILFCLHSFFVILHLYFLLLLNFFCDRFMF